MIAAEVPERHERLVRVVVADDHPLTRSELSRTLARHPGLEVVGLAKDGAEALELVRALDPDVLLMDVRMPRLDGLEAARKVRATARTAVVLISTYEDALYQAAAADAGAAAYLSKAAGEDELTAAVLTAAGRSGPRQ